jgi:hypothetical protein
MKACKKCLRGDAKSRDEPLLVKTDNQLIAHKYHGDTHLARLLDHLLALLQVASDVELGVADILLLKEILSHLAEVAGRRAVDGDFFIHMFLLVRLVYHAELSTEIAQLENALQRSFLSPL